MKGSRTELIWKREISCLLICLKVDARNHRMLAEPWQRAAMCMASAWRNRASQPNRPRRPAATPPESWQAFVSRATTATKVQANRPRSESWEAWARARVQMTNRYHAKDRHA